MPPKKLRVSGKPIEQKLSLKDRQLSLCQLQNPLNRLFKLFNFIFSDSYSAFTEKAFTEKAFMLGSTFPSKSNNV